MPQTQPVAASVAETTTTDPGVADAAVQEDDNININNDTFTTQDDNGGTAAVDPVAMNGTSTNITVAAVDDDGEKKTITAANDTTTSTNTLTTDGPVDMDEDVAIAEPASVTAAAFAEPTETTTATTTGDDADDTTAVTTDPPASFEPAGAVTTTTTQPPLFRKASAGDTQPLLAVRQASVGGAIVASDKDDAVVTVDDDTKQAAPAATTSLTNGKSCPTDEQVIANGTANVSEPALPPPSEDDEAAAAAAEAETAPAAVPEETLGSSAREAVADTTPFGEGKVDENVAVAMEVDSTTPNGTVTEDTAIAPPPAAAVSDNGGTVTAMEIDDGKEHVAAADAADPTEPTVMETDSEVLADAVLAKSPPPPAPAAVAAVEQPPQAATRQPTVAAEPAAPAAMAGPPPGAPPVAAGAPPPPPPAGGGGMFVGGMKELRVEDALLYLDDVKREFGDRPRVYNEFLAIMKNFKSQEVDTPGVIRRVSKLFRGYNNLILGFNKFLPDGYKISMADLEQMDAAYAREQEILSQQQLAMASKQQNQAAAAAAGGLGSQHPGQDVNLAGAPLAGMPPHQAGAAGGTLLQQHGLRPPGLQQPIEAGRQPAPKPSPAGKKKSPAGKKAVAGPPGAPQQLQQPQQMHQAVEFDHAISYVTTIKRRFANDPSTYHSFLEILHTYQKEQRGIKEVLEQVAHLFQDHPDLLKEFTFFLPDAVQEQAKERLHRAAADSEARLAAKRAAQQGQDVAGEHQKFIDMTGQGVPDVLQGRKRKDVESGGGPTPIAFPQHPEQYIYNSAVERQFFDAAKEALATYTRDGGQAWAEFLKCLDMYAQEILSRSEMLNFVEPLLGKRNNKLFEEFKRILQYAGGQGMNMVPSMEDSWYSVPLSEIDFSRCRKCSPSYRKLPRDYPAPPCSQRSDEEAKVLNDEWVSLPVGSEESYTFRHMRRNTYEETLFRVEDERFEIDMAIDSNLCTLALLEPFAEEMAQLSQNELVSQEDKEGGPKPANEFQGLGGKYFRYTFDNNILGVIHRNSITRIYGDAGKDMLDLMVKNPTVAIPLIVRRLQQKDVEWRRVRERLDRHWKELAEHNYYKSLDHRSLTWRTTDKRAISTRTLISEIKDRSVNNGNEGQSAIQARMDKAKEEHGTFYEVTMASVFYKKLDLSELPKSDRRLFTPHMALIYNNNTHVQRDAYRILSFALERGSISPADKERCHRLWTEFLGPWFHLNMNWMLSPAVTFQETSTTTKRKGVARISSSSQEGTEDDDSIEEDGDANTRVVTVTEDDNSNLSPCQMDHHPLPAGSTVSTVYGEGRVLECRKKDDMYVVKLAFGTAFLRPSAVLCSLLAAEKSAYTTQRRNDDLTKLDRPDDMLAIGTQSLYLFFRLHQILCRRIGIARKLAYEVKNDSSLQTLVEEIAGNDAAAQGRRRYDAFMGLVFALLDGGTGTAAEGGKFEDRVRSLLGHGGFELATMDKLISHILKNIQSMANDDTMWSLVQLFRRHLDAGGFKPEAFRQEAAFLSDGESMYAFQSCPIRKGGGGDKSILYMEYLGVISGSEAEDDSVSDLAGGSDAPVPAAKRQKR